MTWKKGETGNPGGRPEKTFAEQVRIVCAEEDQARKKRKLRCLAEKLYEEAMKGEGWAMCQIADRLDGKPATESTVTVNEGNRMSDAELREFIAAAVAGTLPGGDGAEKPRDPSQFN